MEKTWTCECGNINSSDTCLKCSKPRPPEFTEDEVEAFKCQNKAARASERVYCPVDINEASELSRKYFTTMYTLARRPLLNKIAQLRSCFRRAKTGDKIWTKSYPDGSDPVFQVTVTDVDSTGFFVREAALKRFYNECGTKWFWDNEY